MRAQHSAAVLNTGAAKASVPARYLLIRIREGRRRIAAAHPADGFFAADTPGLRAAEDELNEQYRLWKEGANEATDVDRAFMRWEAELVAANQVQAEMFGS